VQVFKAAGSAAAAFFAALIMASELSIPWTLPVPFERVLANSRLRIPSGVGTFVSYPSKISVLTKVDRGKINIHNERPKRAIFHQRK
jgi:hypothetical protein